MSDRTHETGAEEFTADVGPHTEAVDEILSAVLARLNLLMFDLLQACIRRTRKRRISPTVKDVALLQSIASRTLNFWCDGGFGDRQEHRRLARARRLSGADVEPVRPGSEAHHTRGRDLAVWYSPLAGTSEALTTAQAAYICEQEVFRRLDRVVEGVILSGFFVGTDPEVLESVSRAIREHREFWTSPAWKRRGEQVQCEHCKVALTHLNAAEVGDTDECAMCRGWFSAEQRREQRQARLLALLDEVTGSA